LVVLFSIESVWKIYTEEITPPYPRYLFVYNSDDGDQTRLFKSDEESHAEQKFMEAYREANGDRYKAKYGPVQLNMYLTFAPCGAQEMNCARALRKFANDYNFKLNIKAVRSYHENEEELCDLMTSQYCTVRSFTKEDYKNLARYLDTPLLEDWEQSSEMIERDRETRLKLEKIRYSKYIITYKYYSTRMLK